MGPGRKVAVVLEDGAREGGIGAICPRRASLVLSAARFLASFAPRRRLPVRELPPPGVARLLARCL
eukprot:8183543-Alexandrium_andersonii.AAC.1